MAFQSARRRVVAAKIEATQGVHSAPAAADDAVPLIRSADASARPILTERETLRQSLTGVPDIFPGVSLVDLNFTFELHADEAYVQGAGVTLAMRPIFNRIMTGAAYNFLNETEDVFAYKLVDVDTDNGPMRHLESVTGTGITPPWRVIGDTFGDDGVIFLEEEGGGTLTVPGDITGGSSGSIFGVDAKEATDVFAWHPLSTLPFGGTPDQRTLSMTLWKDGKKWQIKGAMGDCEFQFQFGDAVLVNARFQGVLVDYTDEAIPTDANEGHKFPPTFLGTRVTLRQAINAPAAGQRYGSDGGPASTDDGALTEIRLNTGNNIVLHENALDPNGVNHAIVTNRNPAGSFNPDEVSNAEFDFLSKFVAGEPMRLRIWAIGPDSSSFDHTDPTTTNQNLFDFIASGIVFNGVADRERDEIMLLDATFDCTGSDYDTGLEEALGQDNELVIVHR